MDLRILIIGILIRIGKIISIDIFSILIFYIGIFSM